MVYPLVRELAGDGIPVMVTCQVLKIARQHYYRWLSNPVTDAELAAAYRANALYADRASQFRSRTFVRALHRHGMVGSMGKVGAAGDNAAMESFFPLVQKNVLDRRHWTTRQDLWIAIVTWIERTYHRRRRQDAIGRLAPIEYETIMTTLAAQAA